jgi:N-acetylglucosaminyl-diphospho-decaprenol L-rhamnosyltransferase
LFLASGPVYGNRRKELSVEDSTLPATALEPVPDISVVIVSWNVARLLADCLDSLQRCSDGLVLEVWVVDNASSDNTVQLVRSQYPWVHLIANPDNRGFARANNQGFQRARGRSVFILNPDTIVRDGAIRALFQFLMEHHDVGMVGPCLVDAEGLISHGSARRFPAPIAALWVDALCLHKLPLVGDKVLHALLAPYDFGVTQPVDAISGAAMLVRRELLQQLQGFSEDFVHSGEDLDLCYRIQAAGWKIFYLSEATVVHLVGRSAKQAGPRAAVSAILGKKLYFDRCFGKWQGLVYRLVVQGVAVPTSLITGCIRFLLGRESRRDFKLRLESCYWLLKWRHVK